MFPTGLCLDSVCVFTLSISDPGGGSSSPWSVSLDAPPPPGVEALLLSNGDRRDFGNVGKLGVVAAMSLRACCLPLPTEDPALPKGECRDAPGDFMLGDLSLGSRAAAMLVVGVAMVLGLLAADPLPTNLVGDTVLLLLLPLLPRFRSGGLLDPDLRTTDGSRGEIWLGRIPLSVLGLRSPGEVDATSWANLKQEGHINSS